MLKESYFRTNPTHAIMIAELEVGTDGIDDDEYATGSVDQ